MRRPIIWGLLLGLPLTCHLGCGGAEPVNHPEEFPAGRVPIMPKNTPKAQPKQTPNPAVEPKKGTAR